MTALDDFACFDGWQRKTSHIRDPDYFLSRSYMAVKPHVSNTTGHPMREYWFMKLHHIMHALISIFAVDIDSHLLYQRSFTEREVHDLINPLIDVN